jgi:hypothetical protein
VIKNTIPMVAIQIHAAAVIALLSIGVEGFTPSTLSLSTTKFSKQQQQQQQQRLSQVYMAEEKGSASEPVFITSNLKKEIVYDEASGRFFETGYGEGDCVPDEEFCMTDNDTGDAIRLTVEEKERIFLDALQVRDTIFFFMTSLRGKLLDKTI